MRSSRPIASDDVAPANSIRETEDIRHLLRRNEAITGPLSPRQGLFVKQTFGFFLLQPLAAVFHAGFQLDDLVELIEHVDKTVPLRHLLQNLLHAVDDLLLPIEHGVNLSASMTVPGAGAMASMAAVCGPIKSSPSDFSGTSTLCSISAVRLRRAEPIELDFGQCFAEHGRDAKRFELQRAMAARDLGNCFADRLAASPAAAASIKPRIAPASSVCLRNLIRSACCRSRISRNNSSGETMPNTTVRDRLVCGPV